MTMLKSTKIYIDDMDEFILAVEGTGDNTKATVQFENVGTKQLLLKFAKFEVIG